MQLVLLREVIPEAIFDLRYASANNIAGRALYQEANPKLDEAAARQLKKAAGDFARQNLQLVIWDAYRSPEAHAQLQKLIPDVRYVTQASKHSEGLAVDMTLTSRDGKYLDMGTDFDDFSLRAHPDNIDITGQQAANRKILSKTMQKFGFRQWPYEWWHFEYFE